MIATVTEPAASGRGWYNADVAMFFVVTRRSGPQWDPTRALEEQSGWPAHAAFMDGLVDDGFVVLGGPLADERRVVLVIEAESEDAVRATLAVDPWSETHLRIDTVDRWTIRLDGRRPLAAHVPPAVTPALTLRIAGDLPGTRPASPPPGRRWSR